MIFEKPCIFPLTVQFEDIDAHGVVHHPNYLKYLERARSYGMKKCGYSLATLLSSGFSLAISEIHANYLRPALLEQELFVFSQVLYVGKSSIKINQDIILNLSINEEIKTNINEPLLLQNLIFRSKIQLVCVDLKSGKPKSLPQDLKQAIKRFNDDLLTNNQIDDDCLSNNSLSSLKKLDYITK